MAPAKSALRHKASRIRKCEFEPETIVEIRRMTFENRRTMYHKGRTRCRFIPSDTQSDDTPVFHWDRGRPARNERTARTTSRVEPPARRLALFTGTAAVPP